MTRRRFRPAIARLEDRTTPAGGLDPAFNGTGITFANFGPVDVARAVAVQPDGKVVVAGETTLVSGSIAVARFLPDGTLDPTFGRNGNVGRLTINFRGMNDAANGLVLQPDGKIVLVGTTNENGTDDFAVVRVLADGSGLDTTFGTQGKMIVPIHENGQAAAVALRPDGRIAVAGSSYVGNSPDFAVVQLTPDGQLDPTFGGGDGVVEYELGGE